MKRTQPKTIDFKRIVPSIDVEKMQSRHVTFVGGAGGLAIDMARCGLSFATLVDFDVIDASNPARQDLDMTDYGRSKVEAIADAMKRANPDIRVRILKRDFCSFNREEFEQEFGHTDLYVYGTDFFPAQARGNIEALRQNIPAVWIGLYQGARAAEIIYHCPGVTKACFRCICSSRYKAFHDLEEAPNTKITSDGGTILDLHLVDAIAGQICVGLLTRGADNRFGQLIDRFGGRNLIQVKLDPDYRMGENDIFAKHLGESPAAITFQTMALETDPELDCPDCLAWRREDDSEHEESQTPEDDAVASAIYPGAFG